MNRELPDVQAGFRKGRGNRYQIANIRWIIEKARDSRKNITSASLTTLKPLTVWITTNWKILKEMGTPDHLSCLFLKSVCRILKKWQLEPDMVFQIGKGVRQGYILSPCLFSLYAEYIRRNAGLAKHKLEPRLPGEMKMTSDTQMTPPFWHKVKKNSIVSW